MEGEEVGFKTHIAPVSYVVRIVHMYYKLPIYPHSTQRYPYLADRSVSSYHPKEGPKGPERGIEKIQNADLCSPKTGNADKATR